MSVVQACMAVPQPVTLAVEEGLCAGDLVEARARVLGRGIVAYGMLGLVGG
jgi:hypothetical protein